MNDQDEFSNPELLPVENLSFPVRSGGVVRIVKALDPHWVEKREWRMYWRWPGPDSDAVGAQDAWTLNASAVLADLKFLLSLRHHRFWSHIIHSERCVAALVTLLQQAEPPYLECSAPALYQQLYARLANVLCRMVTNRESRTEWMTREYLGKIIYDEYLISIPTLWDFCLLYGIDNPQPVSRLLHTVFTLQPKYTVDLGTAIAFVQEVFKYVICQVNNKYDSTLEPPNLPETFKGFSEIRRQTKDNVVPDKITLTVLNDLVLHLLDSVMTIRLFAEAYPPTIEVLKSRGFLLSIVQLYENAIPAMYEKLDALCAEPSETATLVLSQLATLRGEAVDVVREVLAAETDAVLSHESNKEKHIADYLSAMMDLLSEKILVRDYNAAYPVHDDLEMLRQAYPQMDSVKIDFILQAVYSNLDDPAPNITQPNQSASIPPPPYESMQTDEQTITETDIPSNLKEESLISEVKDIFPNYGDGYILKCLQHYGFNSARVINSILEGNLDQSLRTLDESMPIIPPDPLDVKFLQTGIDRLNVFDGDEFDVMTRDDIDLTRVHVGKKKEKFKDLKQMLDDKSSVKQRMDIYSKYNLVTEEESLYSDEYDDTYDSAPPAARDADALEPRRVPRVLQQLRDQEQEDSSSAEEPEPTEPTPAPSGRGGKPLDFCVNPELIRERREASWRANQKPARAPPKGGDVVGRAKGQGQEKEVLVNRDRKNQNKSSRGNHSRRQGAQWKRSQGMMPS